MIVTSNISVDLTRPNMGARVNAVQGDGNTRQVEIILLSGGAAWTPPDGVEAAIALNSRVERKACTTSLRTARRLFPYAESKR